MKVRDLTVTALRLDKSNFRIPGADSHRGAIKALIAEQGEKLVNLAEDIAKIGLSPAEPLLVTPHPEEDDSFLVCEGNRRLAAVLLLHTPDLAHGTAQAAGFRRVSRAAGKLPAKIPCVVFPDKEAAAPWVERKHSNAMLGRGVEKWVATAQARFEASKGNVRRHLAACNFLERKGLLPASVKSALSKKTTTVDRVLNAAHMGDVLGVSFAKDGAIAFENGDERGGAALLLAMLRAMAKKDFKVNSVHSIEDRRAFIEGFAPQSVKAVRGSAATGGAASSSTAAGKPAKKAKRALLDRTFLCDKSQELSIERDGLSGLFTEARKLRAATLPRTAGVLVRVFLELTVDEYLVEMNVPLPAGVGSGMKWPRFQLRNKIEAALHAIDPKKADDALRQAWKALGDSDYIHSIETLHSYVHDQGADPNPREIKQAWDRWFPLFLAVYSALEASRQQESVPAA